MRSFLRGFNCIPQPDTVRPVRKVQQHQEPDDRTAAWRNDSVPPERIAADRTDRQLQEPMLVLGSFVQPSTAPNFLGPAARAQRSVRANRQAAADLSAELQISQPYATAVASGYGPDDNRRRAGTRLA